ncbi:phosphatase PAP2 family protein [Candidatus Woesearchaeota archaeon]|nr:phosphatase PAP2 family protein [Candidatus Woesearchaeota archaeon]
MGFTEVMLRRYMRDITSLGSIVVSGLLIVYFYLTRQWRIANILVLGSVMCVAIPAVIRKVYFKKRPRTQEYHSSLEKLDASSFPSVHATRSFFFAYSLSYYFQNEILSIFFFALAALISYTRIYLKKHDWVDITVGVILGVIIGALLHFFTMF